MDSGRPGVRPGNSQGWRVGAADHGAAVPVAVQLIHERAEWDGQVNGHVTEEQLDAVRGGDDLVTGEKRDVGEGLAVEQHEQARHAVRCGEVLVVQESLDSCPPLIVGDAGDPDRWWRRRDLHVAGVPVLVGPGGEGARLAAAGGPVGQPPVDVGLYAVSKTRATGVEPASQVDSGADGASGALGLPVGDVVTFGLAAEPA